MTSGEGGITKRHLYDYCLHSESFSPCGTELASDNSGLPLNIKGVHSFPIVQILSHSATPVHYADTLKSRPQFAISLQQYVFPVQYSNHIEKLKLLQASASRINKQQNVAKTNNAGKIA